MTSTRYLGAGRDFGNPPPHLVRLVFVWRPIAAYALMRAARDTGDTRTAERALQSLTLQSPGAQTIHGLLAGDPQSSSSPLNSDYRAAVNLIDQLSWG